MRRRFFVQGGAPFLSSGEDATSEPSAGAPSRPSVFANLAFTVILVASSLSNVGIAMFDTSMAWLMTSLNPDPMMVSAVQVATTLPMFLLTLPAGALADIVDARRLLIGAQAFVAAVSVAFALAVTFHLATPSLLLTTTFVLGAGGALAAPAWLLTTPMLVAKEDLDSAISINNTSFNISRAIGPAIGGFVIAAVSLDLPFWAYVLGNLAGARRADLVAGAAPRAGKPAGREAGERVEDRAALRPPQSRHRCDADASGGVFPVRQRLLGAAAADRQEATRQRPGNLRRAAWHDRPRFDRRLLPSGLAQGAPRARPAGGARDAL